MGVDTFNQLFRIALGIERAGLLLTLIVVLGCLLHFARRASRSGDCSCARCGYDLSGSPEGTDHCSECGVLLRKAGVIFQHRGRWARLCGRVSRICTRSKWVYGAPVVVCLASLVRLCVLLPPVGLVDEELKIKEYTGLRNRDAIPPLRTEYRLKRHILDRSMIPAEGSFVRSFVLYPPGRSDQSLDMLKASVHDYLPWIDEVYPNLTRRQRKVMVSMIQGCVDHAEWLDHSQPNFACVSRVVSHARNGFTFGKQMSTLDRVRLARGTVSIEHTRPEDLRRGIRPALLMIIVIGVCFAARTAVRRSLRRRARGWLNERTNAQSNPSS